MAQHRNPDPRRKKKKGFSFKRLMAWTLVAAALAIIIGIIGYIAILFNGQKQLKENENKFFMPQASTVFDANNEVVTKLSQGEGNRELVKYDQIPEMLINAFVATEDRRFWDHSGVDPWSLGRAVVKDIAARSAVEGGSTITQQLAKNMFLNSDKTFFRKATEMSMAMALENNFEKKEIMEMYLNRIFFGNNSWGIKMAAKRYFGVTDLKDLQLWQMATLAGMPKAPSTYNPIKNPEMSKARRAVVLQLMYDQGYITREQMEKAKEVEYKAPAVQPDNTDDGGYETFIDYLVREAEKEYGIDEDKLRRGGYEIHTTLVPHAQQIMNATYKNNAFFQKDMNGQKMQSSMVIVNNKDGGIVAMIGGRDYETKTYNRALINTRSPGSSIKPLVAYAPALEAGEITPYSMLPDKPKKFGKYEPKNYDGKYEGEVSVTYAVKKSKNIPAVELLDRIGVSNGKKFAEKLGIPFDERDNNLAIALGGMTRGPSPLQMAQAYSAFPNNGVLHKAHAIVEIIDSDDASVAKFNDKSSQVMSAKTAYTMTEIMKTVLEPGGTGARAAMNRPAAGKTGSTQLDIKGLEKYSRDLWFAGYTPEWTAAVWMGFDQTNEKHYITMSSGSAAAIFKEVMQKALAKYPQKDFVRPKGVQDLQEPPKGASDLTAQYVPETTRIRLAWAAENSGATFRIYRKEAAEPEFSQIQEVQGATEFYDTSVQPGGAYQYYVKAYDPESRLESADSNIAEASVPLEAGSPSPSATPTDDPSASPSAPPEGEDPGTGASPSPSAEGEPDSSSPTPTAPAEETSPKPSPEQPPAQTSPSPAEEPQGGADAGTDKRYGGQFGDRQDGGWEIDPGFFNETETGQW